MHPNAALLALMGYEPRRLIGIMHIDQAFVAVRSRPARLGAVVPLLTLGVNGNFIIMNARAPSTKAGEWEDVPDRVWNAMPRDLIERLQEFSYAP